MLKVTGHDEGSKCKDYIEVDGYISQKLKDLLVESKQFVLELPNGTKKTLESHEIDQKDNTFGFEIKKDALLVGNVLKFYPKPVKEDSGEYFTCPIGVILESGLFLNKRLTNIVNGEYYKSDEVEDLDLNRLGGDYRNLQIF
jgi:hypothetical protein